MVGVLLLLKSKKKEEGSPYDLYQDGLTVETTLDYELQEAGLQAFKNHLKNTYLHLV